MIIRERSPSGLIGNIVFGFSCIGDGLVRVISLGHLSTTWPLSVSRRQAKTAIKKAKGVE